MKKLLVVFMLIAAYAYAQGPQLPFIPLKSVKIVTNFTASSDDTTGFITVPVSEVLQGSEVGIISVATDSIQAVLYFIGTNSQNSLVTTTYTDSISTLGAGTTAWSATAPKVKITMLRDATVNRLAGCTQFKIGTVVGASGSQGTTAGRKLTHYLFWKQ